MHIVSFMQKHCITKEFIVFCITYATMQVNKFNITNTTLRSVTILLLCRLVVLFFVNVLSMLNTFAISVVDLLHAHICSNSVTFAVCFSILVLFICLSNRWLLVFELLNITLRNMEYDFKLSFE